MKKPIDELKHLIDAFEKVQTEMSDFGATDTEPDGVFQQLLVRACKGLMPLIPLTVQGWELYSDPGAPDAVDKLTDAARPCIDFLSKIDDLPHGSAKEIKSYLRDYCWRVEWRGE